MARGCACRQATTQRGTRLRGRLVFGYRWGAMPVYELTDDIAFPRPGLAEEDGLLAVGGDLRPERLLLAYAIGVFPWPHEGLPLLWFSPDPRMVLLPSQLHVSRRLARTVRQRRFEVRLDTAFRDVIEACASTPRGRDEVTWITDDMIEAYTRLHDLGFAHSAEAWLDGELAGGLYGVSIGGVFTGESMFARVSNASKVALVTLVRQLDAWGFDLFDAQVHTAHVARFGAQEWPRERYLDALETAHRQPTRVGRWRIEEPVPAS